jgi:hypothetical protein
MFSEALSKPVSLVVGCFLAMAVQLENAYHCVDYWQLLKK